MALDQARPRSDTGRTAIGGTILISAAAKGTHSYALAMIALAIAALIGLAVSIFLPSNPAPERR